MLSLLELAARALGAQLAFGDAEVDLSALPEPEIALAVWRGWQEQLEATLSFGALASPAAAAPRPAPPRGQRQLEVLQAFAAAFWRPRLLRVVLAAASIPPGLSSLRLVAEQLLHLELSAPCLWQLGAAAAACPRLRCLSLRGCTHLGDAALAVLPERCTSLQALDLGGLAQLTDGAAYHIAKLPQLAALNLSGTAVTDRALQLLAYGQKVRAWQRAAGAQGLPLEASCWPALPLEHLQLAGARIGPEGIAELEHLPALRFLDCRGTGLTRAALAPLQRRFALQFVQGAVLSSSNAAAMAVVNQDAVACRCGCGMDGTGACSSQATEELQRWEAAGVQLLLHFDPAAGLAGVLEPSRRRPPWQPHSSAAAAAAGAGPGQRGAAPGGRRTGYRQPRISN